MSTLGTPTPGRRSPVYSVLDAQYAEAAFRTGPSVSPADTAETTRPAYAESFYSNTDQRGYALQPVHQYHGMPVQISYMRDRLPVLKASCIPLPA